MNEPKLITVQELKKRKDQSSDICIIDVREIHEWAQGHIAEAQHIPKGELKDKIASIAPLTDTPIYLHCQGGVRSLTAARELMMRGYHEVYSVEGGFADWVRQGYPIQK